MESLVDKIKKFKNVLFIKNRFVTKYGTGYHIQSLSTYKYNKAQNITSFFKCFAFDSKRILEIFSQTIIKLLNFF